MDIAIDYVAGVCGGIAVVLIGHPFDTTKTRLQTSPPNFYGIIKHILCIALPNCNYFITVQLVLLIALKRRFNGRDSVVFIGD